MARRWPFVFAVALLACGAALTRCAHATRVSREAPPGAPVLRVMTWNVNFGLGADAEALEALAAPDADVIFLQETTPAWEAPVRRHLGERWPHQAWLHGPAAGGMAVLSKRPLEARKVENPGRWFPALRVVTHTPVGRVQALAVHLHPPVTEDGSWVRGYLGGSSDARLAEMDHFLTALEPGLPTLVVGDFNEGTSGAAVKRLEERGLRTALPEFAPKAKTWHWPVGPLVLSAQLDHLAYDVSLEPLEAHVERTGRSDHLPVVVDLVRAPPETVRPPAPSGTSLSVSSAGSFAR